jgi:cation diffusion facilitator CzcD-associated flavoprotein CzcO
MASVKSTLEKRVAIIGRQPNRPFSLGSFTQAAGSTTGAGVFGLLAYRYTVRYPHLKATLFESLPDVGGIWSSKHPNFRPDMTTNISQSTCTFSDLAWPRETGWDAFPCVLDVGKYLQLYSERHVHEEDVRLCTSVTAVDHRDGKWHIASCKLDSNGDKGSKTITEEFDYLIIASGFFSKPYTPPIPGIPEVKISIQHSAKFGRPESYQGQNVALIGGSLSAVEIAGLLVPYAANIHHV